MQPENLEIPDSGPVHNPALVQSHILYLSRHWVSVNAEPATSIHLCSETLKNKTERLKAKNCCCNTPILCSAWNPFDKWMCFLQAPSFFSYTISNVLLITTFFFFFWSFVSFSFFCARAGANLLNLANPIWMNTICICKLAVGFLWL